MSAIANSSITAAAPGASGVAVVSGEVKLLTTVPATFSVVGAGPRFGVSAIPVPSEMQLSFAAGVYVNNQFYYAISTVNEAGNAIAGLGYLFGFDGYVFKNLGKIPLTNGNSRYGLAVLPSGNLLLTQSQINDNNTYPAFRFNVASGTWTNVGYPPNAAIAADTLLTLADGRVFSAGGAANGALVSATRFFSESTLTWTAGPSLPVAVAAPLAAQLDNGDVVVAGGFNSTSVCTINVTTYAVTPRANMPVALNGGVFVFAGTRLFAVGGRDSAVVYELDTTSFSWSIFSTTSVIRGNYPTAIRSPLGVVAGLGDKGTGALTQFSESAFNVPIPAVQTYYARAN